VDEGELTSEDVNRKIAEEIRVDFNKIHKEFIRGCELMEFVSPNIPKLIKKIRKLSVKYM